MKFHTIDLPGVRVIELERHEDERGFFARSFCEDEFREAGLQTTFPQQAISGNQRRHTLRGLHFQQAPFEEIKLVSCIRGAVFDVIVDLRPESATFLQWHGQVLDADDHTTLYVPSGFAHGFQTLTDQARIFYQLSARYTPSAASGVRWDDSAFDIRWPVAPARIMSERDRTWPDFRPLEAQNNV
jgi:dTDP-4-dehydrorhamnose 3,5-epimerase